jgi:2-dehydropantoate 2-reductase
MGAGATGGYFGAQLVRAGEEVAFVSRGANLDALSRHGLRLYGPQGHAAIPIQVVGNAERVGVRDIILLAVKTYDLKTALAELAPTVGPATAILCIQNGVDAPAMAAARYGEGRVLGGITRIEAALIAPGVVGQFSTFAKLVFGAWQRPNGPREAEVLATLRRTGIDCELSPDVARTLWEKMLTLCPLAASTSVTRATIGEIFGCEETRALHERAIVEVVEVARAVGVELGPDAVHRALAWHRSLAPASRASMARDLAAGRRIELDQLSGAVVRIGREHGVPTPVHCFVEAVLRPAASAALARYRCSDPKQPLFGEYLVRSGQITEEQLGSVLRLLKLGKERGTAVRLGDALVDIGLVARATVEGLKLEYDGLLAERRERTVS